MHKARQNRCVEMADEAGMGHVRLKPAHSDLPHSFLVRQLEALLGASLREVPGCQVLLANVETNPGRVLEVLTVPAHDGQNASRGVAGYEKYDTIVCIFISTTAVAIETERDITWLKLADEGGTRWGGSD